MKKIKDDTKLMKADLMEKETKKIKDALKFFLNGEDLTDFPPIICEQLLKLAKELQRNIESKEKRDKYFLINRQ